MLLPKLRVQNAERQMISVFGGYNHNLRISEGEFYDMRNLSSVSYPVLSPREKRGIHAEPAKATGILAKDSLCYTDGSAIVIGDKRIEMGLSDAEKTLVSMGAYIIIMPDKKYINTADTDDRGNIEASYSTTKEVSISLCKIDGSSYENMTVSATEPKSPKNMQVWLDTSAVPHTLKQYSTLNGTWAQIATTYVRIASEGIGAGVEVYDGVDISGIQDEALQDLNASMIIWAKDEDYIVVTGIVDEAVTQTAAVTIKRLMPEMDFITEANNRLWGCRYGIAANGEMVNEIYASKLGDFKNWNCYMGISTDSYTASCGTDGAFTGAITHLGYPLFFKEGYLHKIYGNFPANFQIQSTACRGVQKGCHKSLAIVNEVLYYKARNAVCAYDGSLPVEISQQLGEVRYSEATAGAHKNKYIISMKSDGFNLFVYDTLKGLWHREDETEVLGFASVMDDMYYIDKADGKIKTMSGGDEEDFEWSFETGFIGIESPDKKYISRLTLRLSLEVNTRASIYAEYDSSGVWEHLYTLTGEKMRSFAVPVRPKRCDHLRLKMEGTGEAKLFSIAKTIERGSDF